MGSGAIAGIDAQARSERACTSCNALEEFGRGLKGETRRKAESAFLAHLKPIQHQSTLEAERSRSNVNRACSEPLCTSCIALEEFGRGWKGETRRKAESAFLAHLRRSMITFPSLLF